MIGYLQLCRQRGPAAGQAMMLTSGAVLAEVADVLQ
jgi:hypothetical protein